MAARYQKPSNWKRRAIRIRQIFPERLQLASDAVAAFPWCGKEIPRISSGLTVSPSYFIIGSGRSGNTLLRRLLMEQFDTFIPPEIPGLGRCLRILTKSRFQPWEICVDRVLEQFVKSADISITNSQNNATYNLLTELKINPIQIRSELVALPEEQRSLQALLTFLYNSMLERSSYPASADTVIGDKTPWNVFYLMNISRYWPDSKFIHLVRHPLAVANSYSKLPAVTGGSLEEGAHRWVAAVSRCMALQKQKSSANFTTVSYEALVKASDYKVKSLGRFLLLPPHTKGNNETWSEITAADSKLSHHKRINQLVDSSSVELWKCEIAPDLRNALAKIVRPTVEKLALETNIDYSNAL